MRRVGSGSLSLPFLWGGDGAANDALASRSPAALEMAKAQRNVFVCQNCGATSSRWSGKCASCNEWNTITEETDAGPAPGSGITKATRGRVVTLESLSAAQRRRLASPPAAPSSTG